MENTKLIHGFKNLSKHIGVPAQTLKGLQQHGKIPFIKPGYRTILFDPEKVRAALDKFEVKAVG